MLTYLQFEMYCEYGVVHQSKSVWLLLGEEYATIICIRERSCFAMDLIALLVNSLVENATTNAMSI